MNRWYIFNIRVSIFCIHDERGELNRGLDATDNEWWVLENKVRKKMKQKKKEISKGGSGTNWKKRLVLGYITIDDISHFVHFDAEKNTSSIILLY